MSDDGIDLIGHVLVFAGETDTVAILARSENLELVIQWSSTPRPNTVPVSRIRAWLSSGLLVDTRPAHE